MSSARGLHHTALLSSDVERTVRFYQNVLGFPLTELIGNRAPVALDLASIAALLQRTWSACRDRALARSAAHLRGMERREDVRARVPWALLDTLRPSSPSVGPHAACMLT